MRKNILLAALLIGSAISFQAIALPNSPKDETIGDGTTIFYGTEASKDPANPCKGATLRKCAEITTDIIPTSIGNEVTITVKDGDGEVQKVERYLTSSSAMDVLLQQIQNLPSNAEVTELNF